MAIGQSVAPSWAEVIRHADHLHLGDDTNLVYLFRGHEDANWTLSPSLHRAASNDGVSKLPSVEQLLATEMDLYSQFRRFAPNHLPPATFSSTSAEFDWWTLMRHYGVPTRLLDWTRSFYVALYFAACRQPQRDGAIYVVHAETMQRAMSATHGDLAILKGGNLNTQMLRADAPPVVGLYDRRTALLDRMIVQQGAFMCCHNVAGDIETILTAEITKVADPQLTTFHKIVVPAAVKRICMGKLRSMNVTGSSLFPGLDGIGRQLDEFARLRHG